MHSYSDKELTSRVITMASHDCSKVRRVRGHKDERVLRFRIDYCNEDFLRDLDEVCKDVVMPYFIMKGYLCIYRSNEARGFGASTTKKE